MNKTKKWETLNLVEKLQSVAQYPEEAKKDDDWWVRLEVYRTLGFDKNAKKDKDIIIRDEAKAYFRNLNKTKL